MNHDQRRAMIVRAWLLAAGTLALAYYYPLVLLAIPPIAGLWFACCGVDVCPPCNPDASNGFEVEFTGIVNDTDCANCNDYNMIYILDGAPAVVGANCHWGIAPDPSPCSSEPDDVEIDIGDVGSDIQVDVSLSIQCPDDTGSYVMGFQKTYSAVASIDCAAFAEVDIPLFITGYTSACTNGIYCDGSAATCSMTTH